MYGNGVAIGMLIIVHLLKIIQEEVKVAVSVFCAAAVGASIHSTVGYRIATTAPLTIGASTLAYALSLLPSSK